MCPKPGPYIATTPLHNTSRPDKGCHREWRQCEWSSNRPVSSSDLGVGGGWVVDLNCGQMKTCQRNWGLAPQNFEINAALAVWKSGPLPSSGGRSYNRSNRPRVQACWCERSYNHDCMSWDVSHPEDWACSVVLIVGHSCMKSVSVQWTIEGVTGVGGTQSEETALFRVSQAELWRCSMYTLNATVELLPDHHCVGGNTSLGWLFKPIWSWTITDTVLSCLLSDSDVADHSVEYFETHVVSPPSRHARQNVMFVEAYSFYCLHSVTF